MCEEYSNRGADHQIANEFLRYADQVQRLPVWIRHAELAVIAILIFFLPLAFSLDAVQVFALQKYVLFLIGTNALFLFTVLTMGSEMLRPHRFSVTERMLWTFLLLFLICAGVSAALGLNPMRSFWGSWERHTGFVFWMHIVLFAFLIRIIQPTPTEQQRFIILPLLAAGFIQSILAIIQWFDPHFLFPTLATNEFLGRAFGTLGHPNFLGQFLIFPIFAAISQMERGNRLRWIGIIVLIFCVLGLLASENRASMLGIFIGLIFLRAFRPSVAIGAVAFISIAIVAVTFMPSDSNLGGGMRSIQVRSALWRQIPSMVSEHPFFGVGFENFNSAFSPHLPPELLMLEKPTTYPDSSHNFIFDLLIHTGILGTITFAGFIVTLLMMFFQKRSPTHLEKSLLVGIAAALISWQFGFPGIVDAIMFFAVIALLTLRHDEAA